MQITWLGHAGIQIIANHKALYLDPVIDTYFLSNYRKADLILISTADTDHFSMECVRNLMSDAGFICGTAEAASLMNSISSLRTNEVRNFEFCKVKAMPTKPGGRNRQNSILGFLINIEDKTIYYPGDTQYLQEMNGLKPDVLLLPVGGTFSPTAREAYEWLRFIEPKIVIPIHYGRLDGTIDDANELLSLAPIHLQKRIRILKEKEMMDVDLILREISI
ncbi:MAG: MBL fold metallo-hydrolase [Candidatus Aenigmarchaeota archaeon]|nr:MBL fold metallo-hydrolase [Candidatus Aenigmarchaeota archaeon]